MTESNLAVSSLRSFVGCKDFDVSRDFYVAMGWSVAYDSDSLRLLELGQHSFYLQNYYQKDWCENNMLHLGVESVDDWFAFVKDVFSKNQFSKPARHSKEIKDEGYGRVFHVWDPGGVLLHIAQFHG